MADYKGRPGDALESLIPKWALNDREQKGCDCKKWIEKMNKSISWCEIHQDEIVEHLVSSKEFLISPLNKAPSAVVRVGAKRLVRKAIELAKG